MRVDIVEDLLRLLKDPDVERPPDDPAWLLATELALLAGDKDCLTGLLCVQSLPLPCAERLAAHRNATPEALGAFLCRPDLPPDVLLGFVRGERRASVLAPVAMRQGLPDEAYSEMAACQAVSVQSLLMGNPSVPAAAKRAVFERYVKRCVTGNANGDDLDRRVQQALCHDTDLHQWAFDTALPCWEPDRLLEVCSAWKGLRPDQIDVLLGVAEDMMLPPARSGAAARRVEKALCGLAARPGLPDSVLDRMASVAELFPSLNRYAAVAVAEARCRPGREKAAGMLRAASRTELSDLIAAGEIRKDFQILAVAENPGFDLGLACELAASFPSLHPVFAGTAADSFVDAAVASPADLLRVLMSTPGFSAKDWFDASATHRAFTGASPGELVEALTVARPSPMWRRFVELAAAAHCSSSLTDDVVACFGWSDSSTGFDGLSTGYRDQLTALVRGRVWEFLMGRLGTDPAAWAAFAAIVDCSVPLGETADLAALAADPDAQQ